LTIVGALASGAIVGSACLVGLEHRIACGDGYVDRAAGEECDPAVPDSFVNACKNTSRDKGTGACDPETCEIINDRIQCAYCGDGILDDDFIDDAMTMQLEECDGTIIPAQCNTSGTLGCTKDCRFDVSKCSLCGNGVRDEGEECDGNGGIAIQRPCAGSFDGMIEPLQSPFQDYPYTSGTTVRCLSDCTYDRSECGYCGNGIAEGERDIAISDEQIVKMSPAEECDGVDLYPPKVAAEFPQCNNGEDTFVTANVGCTADCKFMERDGPTCCLATGADCPADGTFPRCCHEYSDPDAEQHCSDPFVPPGVPPPSDGGSKCN
jgi:hypothetical protein